MRRKLRAILVSHDDTWATEGDVQEWIEQGNNLLSNSDISDMSSDISSFD